MGNAFRFEQSFFVFNRDGGLSQHGVLSRHWSEKNLQTSSYYSKKLLYYIGNNPDRFTRIWEKDRISIYRIGSTLPSSII